MITSPGSATSGRVDVTVSYRTLPATRPTPIFTAARGTARDYEDVTICALDPERERELLRKQRECTFIWTTKRGEPIGVVMSYIETDDGKICKISMTASEQRARIAAVRRDPRTCVVVSSAGTDMRPGKTVTYRGTTIAHPPEDRRTKDWFYPPFARKLFGFAGEAKGATVHPVPRLAAAGDPRVHAAVEDRLRRRQDGRRDAAGRVVAAFELGTGVL